MANIDNHGWFACLIAYWRGCLMFSSLIHLIAEFQTLEFLLRTFPKMYHTANEHPIIIVENMDNYDDLVIIADWILLSGWHLVKLI